MAGVEAAVDNDVILKAVAFQLSGRLWDDGEAGYLGSAPFVLENAATRSVIKDSTAVQGRLHDFFSRQVELEPDENEQRLAAEIELEAQRAVLDLDGGESILAAMTLNRPIELLETGDKRAIASFEQLLDVLPVLKDLVGRIRCLEQLVQEVLVDEEHAVITAAVCAEPELDTSFRMIFACVTGSGTPESTRSGLESYVGAVQKSAPTLFP